MNHLVSDSLTIMRRNIIKIRRVPDLLVFTTLQPIMFVLLFGFVFGALAPGEGPVGEVPQRPLTRLRLEDGQSRPVMPDVDEEGDVRRPGDAGQRPDLPGLELVLVGTSEGHLR